MICLADGKLWYSMLAAEAGEGFHSLILAMELKQSKAGVDVLAPMLSNGPYLFKTLPLEDPFCYLSKDLDGMIS